MVEFNPQKATDFLNGKTNLRVKNVIQSVDGIGMKIKLQELLDERGLTQQDIVKLSGIGQNMISAFCNNRVGVKIGYAHIFSLMVSLRLSDISQLLEVTLTDEVKEKFDKESANWIAEKHMPSTVQKLMSDNEKLDK